MATKRSDGRWMEQFTVDGKRYTVYARTKGELRTKENEKRQEIEKGSYKTRERVTVNDFFDRWIENRIGVVSDSTIRLNKVLFNTISASQIDKNGAKFGDLLLRDVETQNVRDLQRNLSHERATSTVNISITLLKSIFAGAVDDGLIDRNPAAPVKSLKRKEEAARDTIHRALTREETNRFLTAAEDSWYINLYRFLLNTGCRIGEAGALFRSDITPNGIQVMRTITRDSGHGFRIGDDTKTAAGQRYIPLSETARKAIEAQQELESALHGKVIGIRQPLFRAPKGGLIEAANVNRDIRRICARTGIAKFTVHAFRDTFATRCVESGMDVKTLQEIMGHTDVNLTLGLYAHAMDTTKENQLKAVNFV